MSERITHRNIDNVATNLLEELKRQGKVPADAVAVVTRAEPAYGITWGVRIVQHRQGPRGRYEHQVPTVLDHALYGALSTREAWQILDATLRTIRYPWDDHTTTTTDH